MFIIQSIVLGILEGIFAFLPVSSSGHLALVGRLLHMNRQPSMLAMLALAHLGSSFGVVLLFKKDVQRIIGELFEVPGLIKTNIKIWLSNKKEGAGSRFKRGLHTNYGRMAMLLVLGNLCTCVFGAFFSGIAVDAAESYLSMGVGFLFSAVFLLVAAFLPRGQRLPRELQIWEILVIGIFQGAAVFPGVSRVAVTLSMLLLMGQTRKGAVKCSLLMSLPISLGAFLWECRFLFDGEFDWILLFSYILLLLSSALSSMLLVRTMVRRTTKGSLSVFAFYSLLIAIVAIVCHFAVNA